MMLVEGAAVASALRMTRCCRKAAALGSKRPPGCILEASAIAAAGAGIAA